MEVTDSSKTLEDRLRREEALRRKREGMVILVTTLMVLLFAFFEVQIPEVFGESSLSGNIGFFLLLNINIILLILLIFLVVRNLVKLIFERKKRILGSRLRVRLVLAFIALSLVPSVLLFIIAGGFVTRSFERLLDVQVENALQGSLEIGQTYYQNSANNALFYARQLSQRITQEGLFDSQRVGELKEFIQAKQREYNLGTVEVFSPNRQLLVVAFNDQVPTGVTIKPESDFLNRALRGLEVTRTQAFGEADIIRGGVPIYGEDRTILGVVIADYYVPKSISKRALQISRSYEEHKHLTFLKKPVKNTYIMTLLLITLVIIFSATWFGLYLAKGITVPIQRLAEGTHEVAHGNWDYQIEAAGDDEIGTLVDSFNQMTRDLKQINLEVERRGRYMETLLANITAGVISVDPTGRVTTMNRAAEQMVGVRVEGALGKNYGEVFQSEHLRVLREIIEHVRGRASVEREVKIPLPDQILTLMVTAAAMRGDEGNTLGIMVFLEDITQIQKVQRMEAWREVARRIAHEIKNPLTPIQLSAERLRKRYAKLLEGNGAILDKCTSTIIKQVEELKNLVNEFSQFARLPAAELAPNDLNEIVKEALFLFKEGHRGIDFQFYSGEIPSLELDRDQIKRALINLLDNAVAAVGESGEIKISTVCHPSLGIVQLEVADDGCGLAPEVRARIFEPYFSTKKDGTGLGLAIVSAIVADHRGYIRVRPNEPKGTRFIVELPVREQADFQEIKKKAALS
ncbi:MAG: PAS domain-containing protein [Deltaproteobacteria bacterium]|nr:PAS domain-containing protein [Deltaproteobacteria bacterium]MBI2538767.1 PAS domain-containing protein [Deltaproteobacteria bacterium]